MAYITKRKRKEVGIGGLKYQYGSKVSVFSNKMFGKIPQDLTLTELDEVAEALHKQSNFRKKEKLQKEAERETDIYSFNEYSE